MASRYNIINTVEEYRIKIVEELLNILLVMLFILNAICPKTMLPQIRTRSKKIAIGGCRRSADRNITLMTLKNIQSPPPMETTISIHMLTR